MTFGETLEELRASGNLRHIPSGETLGLVDFTSNDYLGLARRHDLLTRFLADQQTDPAPLTASASRLLAARQKSFNRLEALLADLYGRPALLFNSGYHANTGIVSAVASQPSTLIVADKLVHASIIDGIVLSRAPFKRFRHNDYGHLERILESEKGRWQNILIIVESVYSMDGDRADIERLADIKRLTPGALLYVDEAHAVGVEGPCGLGLTMASGKADDVDIIVGTFGKALASSGAFAVVSAELREFLVNRARSLIFSTAMAPMTAEWTRLMLETSLTMDAERTRLKELSRRLAEVTGQADPSHIQPLMAGDARRAVMFSEQLRRQGYQVLPIRTPTVPAGTERLRISLSAALTDAELNGLAEALKNLKES